MYTSIIQGCKLAKTKNVLLYIIKTKNLLACFYKSNRITRYYI